MPYTTQDRDGIVVVKITGKFLGSIEGPSFKEMIDEMKEAGKTRVVIALSKADLMDSSGIGTLIAALTTMRNAGGDILLAGMKKRIKNIFLMTRLLGSVFDDYDTLEEALAAFQGEESPS